MFTLPSSGEDYAPNAHETFPKISETRVENQIFLNLDLGFIYFKIQYFKNKHMFTYFKKNKWDLSRFW